MGDSFTFRISLFALLVMPAAGLSACSTVPPAAPATSAQVAKPDLSFVPPDSPLRRISLRVQSAGRSWVDARAKTQNLLYVSAMGYNAVNIYAYPSGTAAGKLADINQPSGLCTGGAGAVWVVESLGNKIVKFAHGGKKPLATLTNAGASKLLGCAVDPTTGNLAVADLGNGSLWVYTNAKGSPKKYQDANIIAAYFCTYDASGNLYVDGVDSTYGFRFAELPSGSGSLQAVTLDQSVGFPGGVRWDGQYVAIGDQEYQQQHKAAIYQVTVSGSNGTVQNTTPLTACDILQFDVATKGTRQRQAQGNQVIAPDVCESQAGFFNYPAGGSPTKTISGLQYPVSAVVSFGGTLR